MAQVSKEAWVFSWSLLAYEKPIEVQYFGASSLHLKISKCWDELGDNESDKLGLRTKLLETFVTFISEGRSRVVQTRIGVALASYVVHTIPDLWKTAIADLISNFNPDSLGSTVPPLKIYLNLIELLMMIPEEFHTQLMSQQRKNNTRMALIDSVPLVFGVVKKVMQEASSSNEVIEIQQAAIKCFNNWTQHLGPLIFDESHDPVLELTLSKIGNEELVNYVVEALTGIYTHPDIHRHPNSVLRFIHKLMAVEPILIKALEEKELDFCSSLFSLFIQVAETHSRLLLDLVADKPEEREVLFRLMAVVLKCCATPGYYPIDETCSEQSFNFFYILQDDIVASDGEKGKEYMTLFKPLYQSLIETLLIKVQFPPDHLYDHEWSSEDKEAFRCYRQDIGDTFMYCYNMLRSTVMVTLKYHFDTALNILTTSSGTGTSSNGICWQPLEAVIFALTSVAENIEGNDESAFGEIFNSLSAIPFNVSDRLLSSTMEMIGAYTEWIFHHPNVLPHVLQLLLLGLKGQHLCTVSATMALKDVTRECQNLMPPFASSILVECSHGLCNESHLKPKEKVRLACTIGQILSILPEESIQNYLSSLLPPIFTQLQTIANYNIEEKKDDYFLVRNECVNLLNIVASLYSGIDLQVRKDVPGDSGCETSPALYQVYAHILPIIASIGVKWINEETVVEALSEVIKKAILTLLDSVKPLVLDVLQLINQLYSASSQPALIDVMKQLLLLFSVDQVLKPQLIAHFGQFCSHTISVCQDMREKTNLIEYFYSISAAILRKQSSVFASNVIDNQGMFRLACAALLLPERPSVKAAASFLTEFINKSRDSELMASIVNNDGEAVVTQVFVVIGGAADSPRNVIEFTADILIALNQKYFDNLTRWFQRQIEKQDFPTNRVTREHKENFVRQVLRERKNKRKVKEIVSEFALVTRGLVNEYGYQSIRLVPY